MPSIKGKGSDFGSDFAPALDQDPVFERTAVERWQIAPKPEPFEPGTAAGSWADTQSQFDLEPVPGPGFLDPGTQTRVAGQLVVALHRAHQRMAADETTRPVNGDLDLVCRATHD